MVKRIWLLAQVAAFLISGSSIGHAQVGDWAIAGTILTPDGIVTDSAISISDGKIKSIGPIATLDKPDAAIKVPGIILPGFIDLHNHLTWNVLPRWLPGRKFHNRYEWQDTDDYTKALVNPHTAVLGAAACESEVYAEIKALAGGATSVVGSLLPNQDHPKNADCAKGLARNLDLASDLGFKKPDSTDTCPAILGDTQGLLDFVDNEVFPFELAHPRFDYLLCELAEKNLRSLIVHLSEGANTDSSAHREFTELDKAGLLHPGLVIIHGTAIRAKDFDHMAKNQVGLIWSPHSNDELYGSTTDVAAARAAGVTAAIAPDWSPSGSAGMLQELLYIGQHYPSVATAKDLVDMATSIPAKIARLDGSIGTLAPNMAADLVVLNVNIDPQAKSPLDAVLKTTAANVSLVVVGGDPLYGDQALMAKMPSLAGANLDPMTVCGVQKQVYLGQSYAAVGHQSLASIVKLLNDTLVAAGSHLPDIECN